MYYYVTLKSGTLTKYAGKVFGLSKADAIAHFEIENARNWNWKYDTIMLEAVKER